MPKFVVSVAPGADYEVDASDPQVAWEWAHQFHRENPQEKESGYLASLKRGVEGLGSSLSTGVRGMYDPEGAAQAALASSKDMASRYESNVGLDKVSGAYDKGGVLSAGGEVLRQSPHAMLEQAPNIAASVAGAKALGMAGAASPIPGGAVLGAGLGAFLPSFFQQAGTNLEAQARAGKPINRLDAYASAIPQAALDTASTAFILGRGIIGKLLGETVEKGLQQSLPAARKAAEQALSAALLKGGGRFLATEPPTEVLQLMMERMQAGLPLASDDAFQAYGETAYQTLLSSPMGAVGGYGDRRAAQNQISATQAEEAKSKLRSTPPPSGLGPFEDRSAPVDTISPESILTAKERLTNRRMAMDDMASNLMSLAPEDTAIPPTPTKGGDGTPLHNMATEMPTEEFPLRQEVLDSPEIKQAIDNFRMEAERLMREGDQEGLDQLTRDFTAGLQRLGIANPQDAFGRGLYEGSERLPQGVQGPPSPYQGRYLETGIQRSGDRNTALSTMPEAKQLPLGGVQPTAEEKQAFKEALKTQFGIKEEGPKPLDIAKKQGGMINVSSLREDYKATKDLGDGVELRAYTREANRLVSPYRDLVIRVIKNGKDIGGVSFEVDKPFGPEREAALMSADMPFISEEHRGQNLGREMYLWAAEQGNDIVKTDGPHTPSGRGMWDSMDRTGVSVNGRIAAKQRGGAKGTWNPGKAREALRTGIDRAINALKGKIPKTEEASKEDVVKKVPGFKDLKFISKDPEPTSELIAEIVKEKEQNSFIYDMFQMRPMEAFKRAMSPGRIATQYVSGKSNKLIEAVGRTLENARNRFEVLKDATVEPIKRTWQPILRNKAKTDLMSEVFFLELNRGTRFTQEQLLNAGLTPDLIKAYDQMRSGLDIARDKINAVRAKKKQKPISMLEAYMSSTWLGPWKAKILDSGGNTVGYIAETSAYARGKAIAYIKQNAPDLKIADLKYDHKLAKHKDNLQAGFEELLDILGKDDPTVKRVSDLLASRAAGQTINIGGVEQHFKRKTGMGGFAGDRPWADRHSDQSKMFEQQINYITSVLKWSEYQSAQEKVDLFLNNPEIQEARPSDVEYLKELVKMERGIDTLEAISQMEDLLRVTGLSPRHLAQAIAIGKSYFYMTKLGLNTPYMAVSLAQPFVSMPPALIAHKANFFEGMRGMMLDGVTMAVEVVGQDIRNLFEKDFIKDIEEHKLSDFTKEAIRYGQVNRVAELNQLSDVRDVEAGPYRQGLEKTVGYTITAPELVGRSMAYMGFVNGLKHRFDTNTQEGRLALFELAAELTKEAMGDYNPSQKPALYQRLGLVGNAAFTLQTFIFNHIYQTYKYLKMASKGDVKPLFAYLTMQLLFAGATGMIGVEDADDMWAFLKTQMPHDMYVKYKDTSIKGLIADNLNDFFAYGGVSTLTGSNIYSRFSTADILRTPPFENPGANVIENFFPFVVDIYKQGKAAFQLLGNAPDMTKRESINTLLPSSARPLYEESQRRKDIIPRMGEQLYGQVRRPTDEKRIFGFRSLKEQRELDKTYAQKSLTNAQEERLKDIRKDFFKDAVDGKDVSRHVKKAIEIGADPTPWLKSIGPAYMKAYTTMAERELIRLGNKKNKSSSEVKTMQNWWKIYNEARQ